MNRAIPKNPNATTGLNRRRIENCFARSSLNIGRNAAIRDTAISKVMREIIRDSPINWLTRSIFLAPITLRTPTSFARVVALAVLKFMKLNTLNMLEDFLGHEWSEFS